MSGWSCPNNVRGECTHVPGKACDPGMKGCVIFGRFRIASPDKTKSSSKRAQAAAKRRAAGLGDGATK